MTARTAAEAVAGAPLAAAPAVEPSDLSAL
ncbi:MAG: hypothetical protein QOD70_943, partial [Frankiales bacterium]|nr:hypothetical protein [Frankiales bacterium]